VKRSISALTIGPILLAHLVGAEIWVPLIRVRYLAELATKGVSYDHMASAEANVALLCGGRRVEKLTLEEILQLKSYPIPEPDLLQSALEMAGLLEANFLPEVTRACTERVR
jgi:hypothetical protein